MSMRPKDIQDSIKIALDAADAATDVTAEYGKIKRENQALEGSVKKIQRSTTIIFFSAVIGVVVTSIFAGLVYFRTMSDLNAITSTSREALVVFAENVNEVNTSLTSTTRQSRAGSSGARVVCNRVSISVGARSIQ